MKYVALLQPLLCSILPPHHLELLRLLVITRYCNVCGTIEIPNLSKSLPEFIATISVAIEKRAVNRYALPENNFNRTPTVFYLPIFFLDSTVFEIRFSWF